MSFEWFIAMKHLLRRQRVGFISIVTLFSVLGIAVGVMVLIVVLSVMSGFDRELKAKIVGVEPHLLVAQGGGVAGEADLSARLRAWAGAGLASLSPYVEGQGLLQSDANATGVLVRGVFLEHGQDFGLADHVAVGEPSFRTPAGDERGVLLGIGLAHQLGVRVGSVVDLVTPHVEREGLLRIAKPRTQTFTVTGIFDLGMNQYDTQLAVISLREAQILYGLADRVSALSLRFHDVDEALAKRDALAAFLGPLYVVESWRDLHDTFFAALAVEKAVMTVILLFIILVAAFNIIAMLIMIVTQKTRDIGILRALGATRAAVRRIFLIEGMMIGAFGTLLGGALGFVVTRYLNPIADFVERATGLAVFPKDIYYFDRIPTEINPTDVGVVIAFAFAVCFLAGLYPASFAARLDPVEAIRFE